MVNSIKENPLYFGIESEYAVMSNVSEKGRERFALDLLKHFEQKMECLKGPYSHGLFTPFGLIYIDSGLHPEFATAEVTNIWDLLYYQKVFEKLSRELSESLSDKYYLAKVNVDYISNTTWGAHENYATKTSPPPFFAKFLIPHLVSRIIYSGAGGFQLNLKDNTLSYCLSPRTNFLKVVYGDSTSQLPLFHNKNERLSNTWQRVHIVCGENLCSETALMLKIATTALIIRLADNNPSAFLNMPVLDDPLEAIRNISRYYYFQNNKPVRLKNSTFVEPVEIQRYYLKIIQNFANEPFMPPWTGFVLKIWQSILNALEKTWKTVADKLDWAIKLKACSELMQKEGYSFMELTRGNAMPLSLIWRLLKFDSDFGKLTMNGIFYKLNRESQLSHCIQHVPSYNEKHLAYPVRARAGARSDTIKEISEKKGSFTCEWMLVRGKDGTIKYNFADIDSNVIIKKDDRIDYIVDNLESYLEK